MAICSWSTLSLGPRQIIQDTERYSLIYNEVICPSPASTREKRRKDLTHKTKNYNLFSVDLGLKFSGFF